MQLGSGAAQSAPVTHGRVQRSVGEGKQTPFGHVPPPVHAVPKPVVPDGTGPHARSTRFAPELLQAWHTCPATVQSPLRAQEKAQ